MSMAFEESNYQLDPSEAELAEFDLSRMQHDGVFSETWQEQKCVEERIFDLRRAIPPDEPLTLLRDKHVAWLLRSLRKLPRGFEPFDALQGWIAFWIIHSLDLLGVEVPEEVATLIVEHLGRCADFESGGYGGGQSQRAHVATTFSVVMALCALGTDEALKSIDREEVGRFLLQMKQEDGSFRMSNGGEVDVRASYCGLAVASLLGLLERPNAKDYTRYSSSYLKRLQSFDGGMGSEEGAESHGGNSYCGVAALVILGELDAMDAEAMLDWAVMRQMGYEGGFQGRTNKLVDSCYSFWVGALFPMLGLRGDSTVATASMFDADALQRYILECCQLENGGLRDKPGMPRDFMHSCYALSGLSIAQHYGGAKHEESNEIRKVNPVYNLSMERYVNAWEFFRSSDGSA